MSDLGTWASEATKKRGWSYRELARRAGISHSLISKVFSDDMPPSADFCIKIASALSESPEKVLRLAGILPSSPASDNDTLQELIELARNLPPEDQKELLDYARFRYQKRKG
ncbi:MAG: helix-turn-helix domain-containing protein [Anaerolineales bacterium]|nr:helix-turn-helix domain-containing protein [Anaerolineales bacterium]